LCSRKEEGEGGRRKGKEGGRSIYSVARADDYVLCMWYLKCHINRKMIEKKKKVVST
jgi:hypothetical protein